MKKIIIIGGLAAAALLAPLAAAGTASAAVVPDKATGSVTWDFNHGQVTGTVAFNANAKTGGSLDYQASNGMWLHGVVTPGSYQKIDAHTAVFAGEITSGSDDYTVNHDGTDYFTVKVVDGARPAAAATSSPCSRTWMAMATGSQAPTPPPQATTQWRPTRPGSSPPAT
jgi:hypothetical protein